MNEFDRVREVLLRDWDPLSIGDNPNLADEYDSFIPGVLKIVKSSRNAGAVSNHLEDVERELGLNSPNEGRDTAARNLIAIIL
jgi:hypothetical protein